MAVRNVAISPSGNEVAVLTASGDLEIYPVRQGKPRVLARGENLAPMHWSRDGQHIFVQHLRAYTDLPARVSRIDVQSGKLALWNEIAPVDRMGVTSVTGIAISADEQSYVYSYRRLLAELFIADGCFFQSSPSSPLIFSARKEPGSRIVSDCRRRAYLRGASQDETPSSHLLRLSLMSIPSAIRYAYISP